MDEGMQGLKASIYYQYKLALYSEAESPPHHVQMIERTGHFQRLVTSEIISSLNKPNNTHITNSTKKLK
jgi:hypothetical protein